MANIKATFVDDPYSIVVELNATKQFNRVLQEGDLDRFRYEFDHRYLYVDAPVEMIKDEYLKDIDYEIGSYYIRIPISVL